jgi:hypothetical protein
MNGTNVIGGGAVSSVPGPSCHAIGTSDFNGGGFSDIQWQNNSGHADLWEMNGINRSRAAAGWWAPGSSWHEVKT